MFFHVRDLGIKPGRFDVELPVGVVDFLDSKIRQKGPLRAAGKVELVSESLGEIRFQGHLSVEMEADCDRCLEPGSQPVDADFELCYRPLEEGYGEEKALESSEADIGFYEGDGVELNDVLREYVLLALPMQRLCSAGCKGICPVCGQNRNQIVCECKATAVDDRWAGLKSVASQNEAPGRSGKTQ
ncbi:MAG: DUF177 domain-containing protein [Acidobacteriota bacterium]